MDNGLSNAERQPDYPGALKLRTIVAWRVPLETIVERMAWVEPTSGTSLQNAKRWLAPQRHAQPSGLSAWAIGEALRFDQGVPPIIPGASGLLALHWFARLSDFVGVLAACDADALAPFAHRLTAMAHTVLQTHFVSPYDQLPPDHALWSGEANHDDLRMMADQRPDQFGAPMNYREVMEAISRRSETLGIWTLEPGLHAVIVAGAKEWFGTKENDDDEDRSSPTRLKSRLPMQLDIISRAPASLGYAYDVVTSKVSLRTQHFLLAGLMTQWAALLNKPTDDFEFATLASKLLIIPGDPIAFAYMKAVQNIDHRHLHEEEIARRQMYDYLLEDETE
jgi:hypothetical protein